MGYTTEFNGRFNVTPTLREKDREYLRKFAQSRRVARKMGPEYGVEGEFYVDSADDGNFGQDDRKNVIDYNRPPRTQPDLWCQWVPTEDGTAIVWDGNEKFYEYVAWIEYLIEKILKPRGYVLNGAVVYQGENYGDHGKIVVSNNEVKRTKARWTYDND